jgi:ppGpp synthetase/RelA/SpoT-type nucleotidyltranferase
LAYSKSKVDRSGKVLAEGLRRAIAGETVRPQERGALMEAVVVIEWWRREHARPLSRVAANLRYYAGEEGTPVVAQRLKKFPTVANKLLREPGMKLSRMADIGGVRAVLPSQHAAYRVTGRLRRNWTITRVRDYVAEPKSDGYRALHLINRNRGRLIEIQLRTPSQDQWANTVETFSRTIAPGLKFGAGPEMLRDYFLAVGELFAQQDRGVEVSAALVERVRKLRKRADTFVDRALDDS